MLVEGVKIQHNLTIETNDEQLLKDDRWYKIEVNRFGNVATLSVKPTPSGQKNDPFAVSGASPAGYSKMDLDSKSYFYIGGTPKGYRVPRELKARNFAGCLSEVILEGKKCFIVFAPNNENGDFVSLELRDGYIIYQFNLGSQTRSVLKTNQKYNTGTWIRLAAERENLQGRLAVEDEYHDGQLPANSPSTMELQKKFSVLWWSSS
ncbi:laminin subunit alpha-1 [Caerostris extrusa]|uniref:Laminin subunit alpha-1 n=1 Tax=Caerostris extrusa TaxID=172846 RepID=A0AAV4YG52_CAEEX|nr:laminin subunit alpha-1 [Caerostris extrusa]